jgi:hypothetical protein
MRTILSKRTLRNAETRSKVFARCLHFLRRGEYDFIISRLVGMEFGISPKLEANFIKIARDILIKQYFGRDTQAPLMNAIMVLDGFITDRDCPSNVRLAAQIEKDRIFGLHKAPAPLEQKITGEIVHRVEIQYTKDWRSGYEFALAPPEDVVEVLGDAH